MLNRQQALNLPVNLCDAGLKLGAGILLFRFERGDLLLAWVEVVWYFDFRGVLFYKHTAIADYFIPLAAIPGIAASGMK